MGPPATRSPRGEARPGRRPGGRGLVRRRLRRALPRGHARLPGPVSGSDARGAPAPRGPPRGAPVRGATGGLRGPLPHRAARSMILRPGAVLGLPEGVPDAVFHVVALRYVLVSLAFVWAAAALKGRGLLGLLAGLAFATTAVGFWVLALG